MCRANLNCHYGAAGWSSALPLVYHAAIPPKGARRLGRRMDEAMLNAGRDISRALPHDLQRSVGEGGLVRPRHSTPMTGISRAKRTARRRSQRTAGALGWENRIPAPLRRWLRDELAPVGRTLGAAPVLALLLLTLPILLLVYQFPRPHRIDV